jgi:hypothetical protein
VAFCHHFALLDSCTNKRILVASATTTARTFSSRLLRLQATYTKMTRRGLWFSSLDELGMSCCKFQEWPLRVNLPRYGCFDSSWNTWPGTSYMPCGAHNVERRTYRTEWVSHQYASSSVHLADETQRGQRRCSARSSHRMYSLCWTSLSLSRRLERFAVPRGYVQTEDGAVAHKLGTPLRDFHLLRETGGGGMIREISSSMTKGSRWTRGGSSS